MAWYAGGDTALTMADGKVFHLGSVSAVVMQTLWRATGALVTGRRDFDVSAAWGGTHPLNVPAFIVTHTPPPDWATRRSPFTFVTDGVASAIAQAKATAGERHVLVNGSRIAQQGLQAGLVDELQIELVPVVLGQGFAYSITWDRRRLRSRAQRWTRGRRSRTCAIVWFRTRPPNLLEPPRMVDVTCPARRSTPGGTRSTVPVCGG